MIRALFVFAFIGLAGCSTLSGVDGKRDFTDDLVILAAGTEFLTEGMIAVIETGDASADEALLIINAGNAGMSVLNAAHYAVNAYRADEIDLAAVLERLIDVAVSLPDLYRLSQINDNPIDGLGGWLTVVAKVGSSSWPTVLEVRREIRAAEAAGLPELPEIYVQSVIDSAAEANARLNALAAPMLR